MLKKYYYLLAIPIFCLLFSSTVNATTSYITAAFTVNNGSSGYVISTTYPLLNGELVDAEDIQQTSQSWWQYKPNFSLDIDLPNGYINGYLYFDLTITTGLTNGAYSNFEVTNLAQGDGIHTAITYVRNNSFRVYVFMDNFQNRNGTTHLGNLTLTYQDKETAYTATAGTNFLATLSIVNNGLRKDDVVQNDRTTALLYSAITQATGQELANIISGLQAIQNQDYVYYAQLVSGINQLHTDNNQLHSDLVSILNEIDLDFAAVQTVLDLFPSYRTQVLQYWQDLLQMNTTQSSEAAEIESQYADRESQSSQLINGMGSLVMPSISSGDLDIMGSVDPNQKANFFGLIALITHNQIVTKIMLIIVLGAIVGYILYGKK